MKKLILLCLFLALTSMLSAQNYKDRGFYGALSFLYSEDELTNSSYTRSRQNFTNKYDLGYIGNIYSPRLLQYTLKGSIRSDKLKEDTSTQKTDSNDYGINLKFIQGTKYPFRIYANQTSSPISTQYADLSTSYIYDTETQGLSGTVNLAPYMFAYGMSNYKGISEYADKVQNTQNDSYFSSFQYVTESHHVSIKYKHNTEENVQHYLNDNVRSVNQVKETIDLSYKTKISEDLKLDSDASYESDEYYETTSMRARADLRWNPERAKYSASLSTTATQLEYQEGDAASVFNAFNVSQTLNYDLGSGISLSQGALIYIYDAPTVKGTNTNLNLGVSHTYKRDIFEDAKFNLSTKLMVQKNDSTTKEIKDDNSTSSSSTAVEKYVFNLNASVTKELPSIESRFSVNSSVNLSTSSEDYQQQRFNFNAALISKLFYIVNNNLSARYSMTNISGSTTSSSYSTRSLRDTLNFNFRLGIRGRMAFNFGMEHISITTDEGSESHLDPMAAIDLNYRFFRRLMFNSSVNIKKYYDTLEYKGVLNLTYKAGKTSVLMEYQYNKNEIQQEDRKVENERTNLKVQLVRRF
ncbi:MAG: hypothetical protein KAR81_06805 [Sulfurimonas sp.]|nr:hypothetical protein [Sulfurimonas sp.]